MVAALGGAGACSSSAVTLGLDVGGETDALKKAPAVTTITVDSVDTSNVRTTLGTTTLPQTDVDLSDAPRSSYMHLEVIGKTAMNDGVVFGRTVVLQLGAADGTTLPIFIQRRGEWARMPSPLADARAKPLLLPTARTVLVAGGGDGTNAAQVVTGYDFALVHALGVYGVSIHPRSLAIASSNAAAILIGEGSDQKTVALGLLLSEASQFTITTPSGGSFDEVAGGPTIQGDDGEQYVVGPARATGAPTLRVLKITKDGVASFLSFNNARLGAAVAWVKNRGLLLFGGSDAEKGAEILTKGATVASLIDTAKDTTTGAGAVALDETRVVLAGGDDGGNAAPTRIVDATCVAKCSATPWGAPLPFKPTFAQLFALTNKSLMLVADDDTGATHTFVLDEKTTVEVPTKIPRRGARAAVAPTGNVVLAGGGSTTVESYYP